MRRFFARRMRACRRPAICCAAVATALVATAQASEDAKPAAAASAGWSEFAPPGLGLRIELPGEPADRSGWLDLPTTKIYAWSFALEDRARKRSITISVNRLATAPVEGEAAATIHKALEAMTTAVLGTMELDEDGLVGAAAGRRWRIRTGDGRYLHGRTALDGRRLVQIILESPTAELDVDQKRTLDSLKIEPGVELREPHRDPDWRWVTPEKETYAVEMPGDPRESTARRTTQLGEVEARLLTWTSDAADVRYEVAVLKLPHAPTADEAEELTGLYRTAAADAYKSDPRDQERFQIGGRPALKWSLPDEKRGRHMRAVVAGDRLYVLTADSTREQSADDRRFLESLKLPK